ECDPGRDPRCHGGRNRGHDHRRRHRCRWPWRLHLPGRRDGRQPDDPGGCAPGSAARDRCRRGAGRGGALAATTPMKGWFAVALAIAVGCGGGGDRIVVGSKNFTEQRILGELLAQTAESLGIPVERRLDLGGTFVCDAAIRSGQIDMYVEYTGTALTAILKEPPGGTPAEVLARVRKAYESAGLVWTAPLGFDNTFALVIRSEPGLRTISDIVPRAKAWRAGFGYEFMERADGYPGLARTYGLEFKETRIMDL